MCRMLKLYDLGWVVGLRPIVRLWDLRQKGSAVRGGVFLRDTIPCLREFRRTTENSERLGRQAAQGIEPGTSRQPVLSAEPFRHW